jgi:hypothetical protein
VVPHDKDLEIPKPFMVRDLLERNLVDNPDWQKEGDPEYVFEGPPIWHDGCVEWVVICTPKTVGNNLFLEDTEYAGNFQVNKRVSKQQGRRMLSVLPNANPINSNWARVIVDEFHEHVSPYIALWKALPDLPGHAQYVFISGTPFNKTESLIGPMLVAEAQYWHTTTDRGNQTFVDWLHTLMKSTAKGNGLLYDTIRLNRWGRSQPPRVKALLKNRGWKQVFVLSADVKKVWTKMNSQLGTQVKKIDGDLQDEARVDVSSATEEQRETIRNFGRIFRDKTIKFSTDYRWLPTELTCGADEGMVAAPMPVHKCFDVQLEIPASELEHMTSRWSEAVDRALKGGAINKDQTFNFHKFNNAIHDFRVLMVFPCLERIMNEDENVREELEEGLTDTTAKRLLQDPKNTHLWAYMDGINDMPTRSELRKTGLASINASLSSPPSCPSQSPYTRCG